MTEFDPNTAADLDSGIFGLPFREKDSALVFLPVPWEATVSYAGGASLGPRAMLKASHQLDLFDADVERPYEAGLYMLPESRQVREWNREAKKLAQKAKSGVRGGSSAAAKVNELGKRLNAFVRAETARLMGAGKIVGVVGGDHSVPYGAIQAAAARHSKFGLLHFDAHLDMRRAYQGFQWSHASIMRNVLDDMPQVAKIAQVGIRDYCEEEADYVRDQGSRARVFFDSELERARFEGTPWAKVANDIVEALPEQVWVSFDIDGLDPRFCPHTGTPVPGGLDFSQASFLLKKLAQSGRSIIGFDLNEVAAPPDYPDCEDEWDANVGMRLLYKLAAFTLASRGLVKFR